MKNVMIYGLLILSQNVSSAANCKKITTGCAGPGPSCSGVVSCVQDKCSTDVPRSAECFKTVKTCTSHWVCSKQ